MKKIIIICLILITVILGLTCMKFLWGTLRQVSLDLDYSESTNTIINPERGWYLIHTYMVNNDSDAGKTSYNNFKDAYNSGDSLVLLMFNLQKYRNGDITNEGLTYINNVLQSVRSAGSKAILRFVYDWDGNGIESEPDDISIIMNHMEQLKTSFNTYEDIIYLVQGIFVGSYGEMHSSRYLDEDSVAKLMNKLLECTSEDTKLSVRTPAYWRLLCSREDPISSLTELPGARIGLYNDGLCSSDSDLGTYWDGTGGENRNYASSWLRLEELNFQSELCEFVPNGGEIAIESEYNDLENIEKEFPLLHISYLNRDYNRDVLEKWKISTYSSEIDGDPYDGVNGYKYVQDHLGYRFVLRDVSISKRIFLNMPSTLEIQIENTGFANMYYPKNISVLFKGISSGNEITIPIDADIRTWQSGNITKLSISIPTKELKDSTYEIYLKIADVNEDVIQLANSNIYNDVLEANFVGEIQIQSFSFKNIWK
ncbi:MAG: DUF4832 domain-containing protein [Eubacteriaceae bacterium]